MNLHSYCFEFIRKNRKWSVANFFLILLDYPLELVVISYLAGQIFTRLPDIKHKYNSLFFLFILIFIAYFVLEISLALKNTLELKYFPKLEREVRLGVIDIVLNKLNSNYDNVKNGEVISRLQKTPYYVTMFFDNFNKAVVPLFLTMAVLCVYLFFLNPKIGAIGTTIVIIYLIIFIIIIIKGSRIVVKREAKENELMEEVDDTLNNSMSIISAGLKDKEQKRLINMHYKYDELVKKQFYSVNFAKLTSGILNLFLFGTLITSSLFFYRKNQISSAVAISIITATFFVVKQLRTLNMQVARTFVLYGTLKDNNNFLKSLEISTQENGKKTTVINGNIRFQNVSFSYPQTTKKSLKNVSFTIKPHDKVAIIGKSGSGKSTILKLILGLYTPQEGKIYFNNIPANLIDKDYLRSKISTVNQNIKLFNRSIIYNIAYGTNKTHAYIIKKLKQLDIMKVFHTLPNGLKSNVGKYGDKLSGGQKQIIYLLRCYFRENPIIILDEPTSSIDIYHKKIVLKMIDEISKNSTLIIVTHDPSIYSTIPKRIFINEGTISDELPAFQPF